MTDYTGEVEVGGPADVRELPGADDHQGRDQPVQQQLLPAQGHRTAEALLVDAAGDPERLLEALGDARLVGIVETHGHWDHQQALARWSRRPARRSSPRPPTPVTCRCPSTGCWPTATSSRSGVAPLTAITLVGHTPGSVALHLDVEGGHLFTGDSLFPGGVGNTEKDAARFASLIDDVETQAVRPVPGQHLGLPGPRLATRRSAPSARRCRVARPRLVAAAP